MKILIVTPGRLPVPAVRGGAVETLIELLLDYNERYQLAEITVVSSYDMDAARKSREYRNCKFYFFKRNMYFEAMMQKHILPYRFFDYCFTRKAGKFLQKTDARYDAVVIENELVNGWVMKRYIEADYFYHAHNDTILISRKDSGSVKEKRLVLPGSLSDRRKRDIRFLESCEMVITISDYLACCFRQKTGINHVATVHNGIDVRLFEKECRQDKRVALRKRYGIKQDETVVVFAGRLVPEKGIEVLLDAVRRIPEEYGVVLLVIGASFFQNSGDNVFVKRLKALSFSIKERILFSGYVDYQSMPDYYSMADIGCVPSLWEEPFGLTVVEQMSMELPVIVSDAGAIPEIVDESCGYLISRKDNMSEKIASAIMDLCIHPDKRKNMGQAGRRKAVACFSRQMFCENWFRRVTERNENGPVL